MGKMFYWREKKSVKTVWKKREKERNWKDKDSVYGKDYVKQREREKKRRGGRV